MKRPDRIPMRCAGEQDALTRWRRFLHWHAGARAYWKRLYRRRVRHEQRKEER